MLVCDISKLFWPAQARSASDWLLNPSRLPVSLAFVASASSSVITCLSYGMPILIVTDPSNRCGETLETSRPSSTGAAMYASRASAAMKASLSESTKGVGSA